MKGIRMLISKNDLVLSNEEVYVKLFVIFKDKKYGTKYIIYTDDNEKELHYGSPLINNDRLVIMKFKDIKDEEMVKEFVWNYLNDKTTSNFDIIELPSNLTKLELIDSNSLDVKEEYIKKLMDIFFKKEEPKVEEQVVKTKKSNGKFIIFVLFLVALGFGGYVYLKNNPELIYGKNIYYECTKKYQNNELGTDINELVDITFNNSKILTKHTKQITYKFNDSDTYYEFKEKNLKYNYIEESGADKFIDEDLSYVLDVEYNLNKDYKLPKDYYRLLDYYKVKDYSCNLVEK